MPRAAWLPAVCVSVVVTALAGAYPDERKGEDRPFFTPANPPEKWTRTTSLPLNARVLKFCKDNLGKTTGTGVSRGECAGLCFAALGSAGARSNFPPRRDTGSGDDYVWGKLVCTLTPRNLDAGKVQPGDLLQVRGPQKGPAFKGATAGGGGYTFSFFHHSSIVQAVARTDSSWWLMTCDQNIFNPSTGKMERWAHQGQMFKLEDMQPGVTIWVYRPVGR